MADQEEWKSEAFRKKVIWQIEEAIRSSNTTMQKSSLEMEFHVFDKAKSRDEYLALVARLILYVKDYNSQRSKLAMPPGMMGGGMPQQQMGGAGMPGQMANIQDKINARQSMTMTGPGMGQQQQVPDVFENDPYARVLFEKALQNGKEKDISRRVNIVGNCRHGKTSLLRQLLGQSIGCVTSTNGIDVQNCSFFKNSDGKVMLEPKEPDELSYIYRLLEIARSQKNDDTNDDVHDDAIDSNPKKARIDKDLSLGKKVSQVAQDSQNQRNHIPMLTTKEKEQFAAIVRNTTPETEIVEKPATLCFWDFAGQFVFYATHALFHSRDAVYLLVFDLSIPLDNVLDDKENPIKGEKKTMKYYLEFWINSIHSFVGSADGSEPVVILVGTHTDKIKTKPKDKYITEYLSEVRDMFEELDVISHVCPVDFAYDTSIPNNPEVFSLLEKIWEVAYQPSRIVEIPAKWLQLQKLLAMRRDEKILSFHEVQQIDCASEFPLEDVEQIKIFLSYHHEKGTYIYFNEPALCDHVILDPQFLVDAFKSIITCEQFSPKDPKIRPFWKKMLSKAVLEQELIDSQWCKDKCKMENKDILLAFLIKHHIISEATRYDEDSLQTERLGWFVVPSLLREIKPEDKRRVEKFVKERSKTDLKFVMQFKISTIILLVFHRLLAAIIDKWPIVELKAKPTDRKKKLMIFQNLAIVNLAKHHAGIAELRGNAIELSVINLCQEQKEEEDCCRVDSEQASRFRRFSESVVANEFRKLKREKESLKPYSIFFRCNDSCHGLGGSLNTLQTQDLDALKRVPCPDNDTHPVINTRSAKYEWYPRILKSAPENDFPLTDKILGTIAQSTGKNWQFLGLELGLSQVDIDHIEEENKNNTVMGIYKMLLKWKAMSEQATFNKLLTVMQQCTVVTFDWDKIENLREDNLGKLSDKM